MDIFTAKETNVVSLISSSGVNLTRRGNKYMGLCPLHMDRNTPSLAVYPSTNSWACFGANCGNKINGKLNGGGPIEWAMQKQNLGFYEAVLWLTNQSGAIKAVKLPTFKKTTKKKSGKSVPIKLLRYWHQLLDSSDRRKWFHNRGFTDEFINQELWGWNGRRYVITVWDGKSQESSCVGVRLRRASDLDRVSSKYIGLTGFNEPTVWGRWHCRDSDSVIAFAGELDAARAVQDGLPATSVVNGIGAWMRFPQDWPNLWFPKVKYLFVCFDKKEEIVGAKFAQSWSKIKGFLTGRVIHWPPNFEGKDFCDFRDSGGTVDEFLNILQTQVDYQRRQ